MRNTENAYTLAVGKKCALCSGSVNALCQPRYDNSAALRYLKAEFESHLSAVGACVARSYYRYCRFLVKLRELTLDIYHRRRCVDVFEPDGILGILN